MNRFRSWNLQLQVGLYRLRTGSSIVLRVAQRKGSQAGCGSRRGRSRADSRVRDGTAAKKRAAGSGAELRSGFLLHAGQCRSQACRRARGQGAGADRFQVHAGARQGTAVAGPGRNPRPRADPPAGVDRRHRRRPVRSTQLDADRLQPRRRRWLEAIRGRRRRRQGQERRSGAIGGREGAILGVSYSLSNKLSTRVAVGAERTTGNPLPALRRGDNVSLDAGASYSLSRRIALTGGVRYNIERDRLSALQDQRRDSQAVYVGTAFKF